MRKVKRKKSIYKRPNFLSFVLVLFLFLPALAGCATTVKEKPDIITGISFSPDGKNVLFNRSNGGRPHMIHVYDLETGELSAYQSPPGEDWFFASYSLDGKHIVFTITPLIGNKEDIANAQVAVMDPDGKNVRKITNTPGFKLFPSFSHSGRKVIFARAGQIRTSGRWPASHYDVYEVDVETGRETRLSRFKFSEISPPYYFPDDRTFIFRGWFPFSYPAVTGSDGNYEVLGRIYRELESKYKGNSIYVMKGNEKELKPYIVYSDYSTRPLLSADGSVLIFEALWDGSDGTRGGYQFLKYSPDGHHRRITDLDSMIRCAAVSPSGELLAVVLYPENMNKIVIYQVKDRTSRDITLPDQPSHVINGQ